MQLGADTINLYPHQTERRIGYRIPWIPGSESRALTVRPAGRITFAQAPVDAGWLSGHLVVIGASYADSRDLHATSNGVMPGALIVANAVHSLAVHGELGSPGLLETLLIELVLVLIMSLLFARFDSFWGSLLSGGAVTLAVLPLSIWLFDFGHWVSFAVPLLAVQLHQLAADLEAALIPHPKQGPSA